jgi:peptide/nickel transport system substrate-binding protein
MLRRGGKLRVVDVPNQKAMTEIADDMMRRVGMNVDYQAVDWGTVMQRRANKGAPAQGGWNAFVTRFVGSEMFSPGVDAVLRCNGGQAWFGWPSSSRIEELREAWFDAPNVAAQRTLAGRIQGRPSRICRTTRSASTIIQLPTVPI